MDKKWEEILISWPKWKKSLETARIMIENKYGDVADLISGAKCEVHEKEGDLSGQNFSISVNDEQWIKWEIETELECVAGDFIEREIGLRSSTYLHDTFVDAWISSVSILFERDGRMQRSLQLEMEREIRSPEHRLILFGSRAKSKSDNRIWNSVSWFDEGMSHREVAEYLNKITWPFDNEKARRHGGGRPKREDTTDIEAIICYILSYLRKPSLREGGIARKFGWRSRLNNYRKLENRRVRKRLTRGRQIIAEHKLSIITQ